MRTIFGLAALGAAAAIVSAASAAGAQGRPPNPNAPTPFNLQREQLGATAYGDTARARARRGDCAGALDAFDQAIRTSIDPTLRRDRGLCHEKMNHPYPAIDDYRAYLTAMPDAADAGDIHARLQRLEEEVGVGGKADSSTSGSEGEGRVTGKTTDSSITLSASATTGSKRDQARDEDDTRHPLRLDSGWIIGPEIGVHKYFSPSSLSSSLWAESVGASFRYSTGPTGTFVLDAGYIRFNTTTQDNYSLSGLTSLIGYEFRFFLGETSTNDALFLMPAVWFDYLSASANFVGGGGVGNVAATLNFGIIGGRARLGYRHLFAADVGFEVGVDGGFGESFVTQSGGGSGANVGVASLDVGLVFGL